MTMRGLFGGARKALNSDMGTFLLRGTSGLDARRLREEQERKAAALAAQAQAQAAAGQRMQALIGQMRGGPDRLGIDPADMYSALAQADAAGLSTEGFRNQLQYDRKAMAPTTTEVGGRLVEYDPMARQANVLLGAMPKTGETGGVFYSQDAMTGVPTFTGERPANRSDLRDDERLKLQRQQIGISQGHLGLARDRERRLRAGGGAGGYDAGSIKWD